MWFRLLTVDNHNIIPVIAFYLELNKLHDIFIAKNNL